MEAGAETLVVQPYPSSGDERGRRRGSYERCDGLPVARHGERSVVMIRRSAIAGLLARMGRYRLDRKREGHRSQHPLNRMILH